MFLSILYALQSYVTMHIITYKWVNEWSPLKSPGVSLLSWFCSSVNSSSAVSLENASWWMLVIMLLSRYNFLRFPKQVNIPGVIVLISWWERYNSVMFSVSLQGSVQHEVQVLSAKSTRVEFCFIYSAIEQFLAIVDEKMVKNRGEKISHILCTLICQVFRVSIRLTKPPV